MVAASWQLDKAGIKVENNQGDSAQHCRRQGAAATGPDTEGKRHSRGAAPGHRGAWSPFFVIGVHVSSGRSR